MNRSLTHGAQFPLHAGNTLVMRGVYITTVVLTWEIEGTADSAIDMNCRMQLPPWGTRCASRSRPENGSVRPLKHLRLPRRMAGSQL